MSPLVMKVHWFLYAHRIFLKQGIVAVSGGPDSVALLRALNELKSRITVAHVNHQLRGLESDADEEFVKSLAEQMELPFISTRITLPKANIEDAARKARYEWLQSLPGEWIATGHTADDQAETVLHRLIRGAGIQGMCGIHKYLPNAADGLPIIRPLLAVSRMEVLSFLEELQQTYCTDSSNDDRRYTRNRIRHEVLPLLRNLNPEIVSQLGNLAQQARYTLDIIQMKSRETLENVELPRAGSMVVFDGLQLSERTQRHLRLEVLRFVWQREGWPLDGMTFDHWNRLASLEAGDYPGGIRLKHVSKVVQLGPRQ